jgi:hypothetical protein
VLAITGSKDIRVNPTDLQRMAELVRSEFESHEIPDVTHILGAEPGEATLATYRQQGCQPVDPRVLSFISECLHRHGKLVQATQERAQAPPAADTL